MCLPSLTSLLGNLKMENKGNTSTYCHFDNLCKKSTIHPTYIYSNHDIWTIPKSYDWYYIRIQSRIKSHIYHILYTWRVNPMRKTEALPMRKTYIQKQYNSVQKQISSLHKLTLYIVDCCRHN